MRKASVFCLVAIYSVIGEELKPHLAQLTGSKVGQGYIDMHPPRWACGCPAGPAFSQGFSLKVQ